MGFRARAGQGYCLMGPLVVRADVHEAAMSLAKIVKACRIDRPRRFRLAAHDAAETFGLPTDSDQAKLILAEGVSRLAEMQQRLYANGRWAVLTVLPGMDAAGRTASSSTSCR